MKLAATVGMTTRSVTFRRRSSRRWSAWRWRWRSAASRLHPARVCCGTRSDLRW